jgi:predicted ATPase
MALAEETGNDFYLCQYLLLLAGKLVDAGRADEARDLLDLAEGKALATGRQAVAEGCRALRGKLG